MHENKTAFNWHLKIMCIKCTKAVLKIDPRKVTFPLKCFSWSLQLIDVFYSHYMPRGSAVSNAKHFQVKCRSENES